eukprot:3426359-Rhodomonas_salina.1
MAGRDSVSSNRAVLGYRSPEVPSRLDHPGYPYPWVLNINLYPGTRVPGYLSTRYDDELYPGTSRNVTE